MGDYGDAMMRNQNSAVQGRTKAQNRVNVLQLKLMGQGHPTGLTATLLKLFEPRPPLEYKPPPEKRKCPPYTGMAHLVSNFAEPGDPEYAPPVKKGETPAERKARIQKARLEEGARKAAEEIEKYDPNNDPNISGDPYKTLFVARLNYETTENKVKREFEAYGPIKRVRLITDQESNKPRGYAFIEYVHTRDMKAAYKQADGKKIDNRRVFVDVERGRTVPNWRPRRLGGGLGTSRIGNDEVNQRALGREPVQSGGISRSEEPRVERDREREKSRDRGKERERVRERSRERSHDRTKDHDHRDRGRNRDRGRDRDQRDRTHDRDRGRDRGRDRDHHRERERERDARGDHDGARGLSRDREYSYDERGGESKRDRGERERNYGGHPETENLETAEHDGHGHGHGHGHYDYYENQGRGQDGSYDRFRDPDRDNDRSEHMDDDGYGYDGGASKSQERDYRRLDSRDRSISREY